MAQQSPSRQLTRGDGCSFIGWEFHERGVGCFMIDFFGNEDKDLRPTACRTWSKGQFVEHYRFDSMATYDQPLAVAVMVDRHLSRADIPIDYLQFIVVLSRSRLPIDDQVALAASPSDDQCPATEQRTGPEDVSELDRIGQKRLLPISPLLAVDMDRMAVEWLD